MQNEAKEKSQACWESHIDKWGKSGLSQRAYCQQEEISHKRFYYHVHRLKNKESKSAMRFIEAKPALPLSISKSKESKIRLRLILPNGVQVALEELGFDVLPQVLAVASNMPC